MNARIKGRIKTGGAPGKLPTPPASARARTPGGRKPKLSGAQRRKLARERAASTPPAAGVVLLPRVNVGKLESLADLRREVVRLYRAARAGALTSELAARLTYVLNVAASLVRVEVEQRQVDDLRRQLAELRGEPVSLVENGSVHAMDAQ